MCIEVIKNCVTAICDIYSRKSTFAMQQVQGVKTIPHHFVCQAEFGQHMIIVNAFISQSIICRHL